EPCARGEDRHARDLEPGREPGHAEPREHHAASCGSPSTHASPPSREYPGAERAAAPSLPRGRSCAARLARASQNPGGTGMRQHALFRKAHTVFTLAREAVQQFSRDRADLLSAALAFFTLLSIAPLIIIAVAIAGAILGEGEARQEVRRLLQETMGGGPAAAIDSWVEIGRAHV